MVRGGKYFIPKQGLFEDVINFKVADITSIDRELATQKSGVVVFKNSLYHLLGSRTSRDNYKNIDIKPAEELFKKINSVLQDKGLFLIGNLHHDHLSEKIESSKDLQQIYQDGKKISCFDNSPIHQALRRSGFAPVFYDCEKTGGKSFADLSCYLPSVWKKIRNI